MAQCVCECECECECECVCVCAFCFYLGEDMQVVHGNTHKNPYTLTQLRVRVLKSLDYPVNKIWNEMEDNGIGTKRWYNFKKSSMVRMILKCQLKLENFSQNFLE